MDREKLIIESWKANSDNWIEIIERDGIESRRLATNKAIIDSISNVNPASVLDIGCGEGWLSKRLVSRGIKVTGVDVIPELINKAKQKISGDFFVASYEDIYSGKIKFSSLFDVIVANFSLIGRESTEKLLQSLGKYLSVSGVLFIQTLHPNTRREINDYKSGWKEGSWDGLAGNFNTPYEWYFRTMEDWLLILHNSGFENVVINDVAHLVSGKQLSVIFKCIVNTTGKM